MPRSISSSRMFLLCLFAYKRTNYMEFDRLQKGKYDKIKLGCIRQKEQ